ncbi:MAG: hypothetical protein E7103_09670 [Prevotella sp.]|jgi:mevalonate kinase|nr:hypothetical protein [Prevotella sp.]
MQHNRSKSKKKKCLETPISGGDILTATLDQLVDYAKNLNDREEAERMELMCYRLFGHRLTPEAADKIAEIPQRFKKKNKSVLKKIVINKGDKVDKKTVIPRVANYNENVDKQENNYSIPHLNDSEKLKIAE